MSRGKRALIVQNPASGEYEVFGPVYTATGLEELEAEAARRGLVLIGRAPLTSKSNFFATPA